MLASLPAAAGHYEDAVVLPAPILWTGEKREWERLVARLQIKTLD